jgi:protein involved in polysaccharide export with SLBB domain
MILRTSIYVDPAGAPAAAVAFQAAAPLVTTVDVTGNSPMVQVSGVKQLGVGDKVYVAFSAEDWQGAAFPGATLTTTYPSSAFFQIYKVGV